jgi:hypothetical protein
MSQKPIAETDGLSENLASVPKLVLDVPGKNDLQERKRSQPITEMSAGGDFPKTFSSCFRGLRCA